MEVEAFQRLDPENFYRRFVKNGVRPDGRELRAVRPISVDVGVLSEENVEASALVGLGSTKVLAGITLQVGHPTESAPMCGMLGKSSTCFFMVVTFLSTFLVVHCACGERKQPINPT